MVELSVPPARVAVFVRHGSTVLGTDESCTACGEVCTGGTTCAPGIGCVQPCTLDGSLCGIDQICDPAAGCVAACTLGTDENCLHCGDTCTELQYCDSARGCVDKVCSSYSWGGGSSGCNDQRTPSEGCAATAPLTSGDYVSEAPTLAPYPECSWTCADPNNNWAMCDASGCYCAHFD